LKRIIDYLFLLTICCGLNSCADDTNVGSDLLGSEDIEVLFTDDFDLTMNQEGPIPFGYNRLLFHSLGTLDDSAFGSFQSSFSVRPELSSFSAFPNFTGATYDSAALVLKIDTSRYYGNPRALFDIEVFELLESIDDIDTFQTDQVFMMSQDPIGSITRLVPGDLDSTLFLDTRGDSTYLQDVILIKLNRQFGGRIFADMENNNTASGFASLLDGLFVKSSSSNSIVQIDLRDAASSLTFFYKDSTGTAANFPYRFSSDNPVTFAYDLGSSIVAQTIDDGPLDNQYYIQGHAGSIVELDISDINRLDDPFVNHASIEVTVQGDSFIDTSLFAWPLALDILTREEDGSFRQVIDLELGNTTGTLDGVFEGGLVIDAEENIARYEMNITTHLKEVLKGTNTPILYLTVRNRVQNPNSLIIFGPDHPTYPARLKLTYTKS